VHGPEDLSEDTCDAARRVDPAGGDLEQRRLAGAVRPEDDPALPLLDLPGDVIEELVRPAYDAHPGEGKDVGHAPNPSRTPPSDRDLRMAACRSSPPACVSPSGSVMPGRQDTTRPES